ncbi:MAG TPA: UDP-N-acetylglucosamine 2-epimerase (non-hydrolyzing) [Steroidobacter sp.]
MSEPALRICTIVGARPQFVKAAVVSRAIDRWNARREGRLVEEQIIHTGQHYDENMSQVFFDELGIRPPAVNLNVGSGRHGEMTGQMLAGIESILLEQRPDCVLVYGDTNSTLAGALAAAKLHIPIAHVEAGLRSFNRRMPEEINRVVTDHLSTWLFCPTTTAMENLAREGLTKGALNVGDVMLDASLHFREQALGRSTVLERLGLQAGGYVLATCHRAENTDDRARLEAIVRALATLAETMPVVLPLHPRTRNAIEASGLTSSLGKVTVTEPVPFLDMVRLEASARVIVTDSGGVQKEAYFFRVPCVTLRDETEWTETVAAGANRLVGASYERIVSSVLEAPFACAWPSLYGDGTAGERVLRELIRFSG